MFIETRIDDGLVVLETSGGPQFSTGIAVTRAGFEYRNIDWPEARGRWELGERSLREADKDQIVAFFRAMRGRAYGFRFKDWADYRATHANGVLGQGVGTGDPTYQLGKKYTQGSASIIRPIKKPIVSGLVVRRNGVDVGAASVAAATGIVTMPIVSSFAVTGVTNANPGVVSAPGHTFTNGQRVNLTGLGGITALNGNTYTIGGVGAGVFNIGISTIGMGTYTSGGTARTYPQASDSLTWAGEFDVPVRFDTDELRTQFRGIDQALGDAIHYLFSLPIIEDRQA